MHVKMLVEMFEMAIVHQKGRSGTRLVVTGSASTYVARLVDVSRRLTSTPF